ncbi:hypothetical protein KY285_015920 [Solanum tuberosum]|nr:hypothetical protein KY285_015920 [Solanum tuberosum]
MFSPVCFHLGWRGWRAYSWLVSSSWMQCVLRVCGNAPLGCTNNNYASREKCKKCGQPKEVAAMPAIAIPGASLPSHPNYFARTQGGMEQRLNIGFLGYGDLQQLPLSSNWSLGEAGQYQSQPADRYRLLQTPGVPYASQTNQLLPVPNGWRNGDWLCSCGFHNYSSRAQCKKCNASAPPASSSSLASTPITALGTKRLASEELVHDWDNKRLNAGHTFGYQQGYPGAEWMGDSGGNQLTAIPTIFPRENSMVLPLQANMQIPRVPAAPTLLGKGAKQWRDGDWMCTNCSNHNYASRSNCNRCKSERDVPAQPVNVA